MLFLRTALINRQYCRTFSNNFQNYSKFIIDLTQESVQHLTPRIKLRLLTPNCELWHSSPCDETYLSKFSHDPYWAIYWPGGQALSKYILDHQNYFKGRRVLDLGCGSGATSIAAALAGAKEVIANDIDPMALEAVHVNAQLNQIKNNLIKTSDFNFLNDYYINGKSENSYDKYDIILIGDMFYDLEISKRVISLSQKYENAKIYIGDPGRWVLQEKDLINSSSLKANLFCLAKYQLPDSVKSENYGFDYGFVYQKIN